MLKSPQHLEQFVPLVSTFPDATFVVTHRDPSSVTISMATMVAYTSRMSVEHVDPPAIGSYWGARVEDLFRACTDHRELLPADQSIDLLFDDFMADDMATVERVYALAGQPLTDGSRAAMEAFRPPTPVAGTEPSSTEPEVLGIDPAERHEALALYRTALRYRSRGCGPLSAALLRVQGPRDFVPGGVPRRQGGRDRRGPGPWRHADAEPSHTDDAESLGYPSPTTVGH